MPDKGYITTFTGIHFSLVNPQPDMVTIEDIAHHLGMVCRWAGATNTFFSVAQHSVLVSKIVPQDLQRWALMHDAAEAYIGDLTRPLKVLVPEIRVVEDRVMRAIALAFDMPYPEPQELAAYDDQIQKLESIMLIRKHDGVFHDRTGDLCSIADIAPENRIPDPYLAPMPPEAAELMFLARFRKVFLDDDGL